MIQSIAPGLSSAVSKRLVSRVAILFFLFFYWGAAAAFEEAPGSSEDRVSSEGGVSTEDEGEDGARLTAADVSGLELRCIGPAFASGRVSDFAVDPANRSHYFVAVASGGVWKTVNAGTTWTPVFDGEGSYSIGCVTMDPRNRDVVWVGTGENNCQRSVSFGNGVYKTLDGGKSWTHVGLPDSEHIGAIVIDPRDSDTVYVAAQGPLWRSGGDRGLYGTTDGGKSWERIFAISEHTGVNEVLLDPRDPDVIYASSYQRRRRVWTLINGGPESTIYKSTNRGRTFRKIETGLPKVDKGRIGLAISPKNPDVLYAIVEAADEEGGFFRSTNRGETWAKQSDYMTSSPQYYNEIVCDPTDVDRVYALDTYMQVTEDGGKNFDRAPRRHRHVDDHALWIDPEDPSYLLVGCDGGVYESFDRGCNWHFKSNLPVSQFYRISVDNSKPFYYVYGGTQDNNSFGGPSRTQSRAGIANEDWFVTVGGDGYETVVDPENPDILYSLWQYGGLVRHDRKSGEIVDIKPREPKGESYRWNWDTPLIISPHLHTRLYVAANKLFRSDDRGNTWRVVSEDLSRSIDRNQLPVMDTVWGVDAVSKNRSTSYYGNCTALSESRLMEGLLYVGTDDGLVQVTGDGGVTWREIESFDGVPERTYVSRAEASVHEVDTVYVAFDNHKDGDFSPYLLKSVDRGRTWVSIRGDLPDREIVWAVIEDRVCGDLLFAGTEFGLYVTVDGGEHWVPLKGGLPTIACRDLDIHEGQGDLVVGTFGRGIYILDDYSPLRELSGADSLEESAILFPPRPAMLYVERSRLGLNSGIGFQGASYYVAPNPPFGALLTYRLKEELKTQKERRQEKEKKIRGEGSIPPYPTFDELRQEDREVEPKVFLAVMDETGEVIRKVPASREKGIHRVVWDLRYPSASPTRLTEPDDPPEWSPVPAGPLALPGTYRVTLEKEVDGEVTRLAGPQSLEVVPLNLATLAAEDRAEVLAFQTKVSRLQRALASASKAVTETEERLRYCRKAVAETAGASSDLRADVRRLEKRLERINAVLSGDSTVRSRQEPTSPTPGERIGAIVENQWYTTSAPTDTERRAYRIAADEFVPVLAELRQLMQRDIPALEEKMDSAGAAWTPGRLPSWRIE